MRLAQRITTLNGDGSDGWDLFNKAREMVAEGHDVIELTTGEHDIHTDPSILEAMNVSATSGNTGYAVVPGAPSLRDTVAARVQQRTGVATTRDNVLITPGGQSALFASHSAVCDPGDIALYFDPYYATYPGTIRGVGAVPRAIQTRPENGFQPQRRDIEAHVSGAKSLLVNSPNNPTGAVYTPETMDGIAGTCIDHDLWLISDEVYDTQVWQGTHVSPRTLPGMVEQTMVIGSMSKSHAMTGSRCGWIIAPEPAIEALINLANCTTYGVAGFVQAAAEFALKSGDALENAVGEPFRRRRDLTMRLLKGQNAILAVPPDAAMYVMLDIRATGMSGDDFADALLMQEHIATMPGESFGSAAAGHIRVAMTVADAAYEDAIKRLISFAERNVE